MGRSKMKIGTSLWCCFVLAAMLTGCEIYSGDDASGFDYPFTAEVGDEVWEGEGEMRVVGEGMVEFLGTFQRGDTTEIVFLTVPDYKGVGYYQIENADAGMSVRTSAIDRAVAWIEPSPSNSISIQFQDDERVQGTYSLVLRGREQYWQFADSQKVGITGRFDVLLPK